MRYFNTRILFFSFFIPIILITINAGNASPQTIEDNEEQSALYLKLINLIKNTGDDIVLSMNAIESGDNMSALNILANVTINLQEISNGLNILVNEPISEQN
jgi:hypothetical protein